MIAERPPANSSATDDWRPSAEIDRLRQRAGHLAAVRQFFQSRGILEVDTPVLGACTVTEPAIDSLRLHQREAWLQTSPEYHLKRLLAAGMPDMVRIGPVFRADEQGRLHNPEFTMIEWYRRDWTLAALMAETAALVDALLGPGPYQHIRYRTLFAAAFDLDPAQAPLSQLQQAAGSLLAAPADPTSLTRRELTDLLFSQACAQWAAAHPGERLFIEAFPADQAALARLDTDPDGVAVALRFELLVDGLEIANGYDELRDAAEMAARMSRDRALREAAGKAVPASDQRLLAAMQAGLPPCVGVALGFDRLLMLALGASRISEVLPFAQDRA